MKKFKNSDAAGFLYRLGVSYHKTGVIVEPGTKTALFDYFGCDKVNAEQRAALIENVPHVHFFGLAPSYAPELQSVCIAFPKAGYFRQLEAQQ